MKVRLLMTTALMASIAAPAFADEETDALRAEIKALEARLDRLERKEAQEHAQIVAERRKAQPSAPQQPALQPAIPGTLEQRVSSLEQQQAATSAKTTELAQTTAAVKYEYGKGLSVTSPDKRLQLRLSGYFQADDHAFVGDVPSGSNDQFFIRSARPILEAKYDQFSARLMMDFGNNQTQLLDAYGDYNAADAFNIRVGKFKDPIGIERWQAEQNVLFVERGMTTNLVPYRDNGVGLYGNLIPGTLEYQLAFTNGSPDLVNGTNGVDNDQSVTGRVFAHPFHSIDIGALQGIGLGVAGSWGNHNGSASSTDLTSGYVTPAQSKFFTYATTAFASGEQWRFNPQATYYNGPFSVISEYVLEDQGLRDGAITRTLQNDAWMATATYVLTGEDARFDGVVPRNNFDPAHDQWGAFELVARMSRLRVDEDAFPVFASAALSAREARESTAGATWYMNPNVKLNLDFAFTQFEGGAVNGNRPDEKAVLSRAQVKF
jgi:phosphate-selective porin OprO/OprP